MSLARPFSSRLSSGNCQSRPRGSGHSFKYRLALVSEGICILRYDNEAGKGDHKHKDGREVPYRFSDLDALQVDFWTDVESWRNSK